MTLPQVRLVKESVARRFWLWLAARLAPPRALEVQVGFGAASYWSLTGALAAGFSIGLYILCVSGDIWEASMARTVGWAVLAVFGAIFWFWPFLASFYMYLPLVRVPALRTRVGAALYGSSWHALAHYLFVDYQLDTEPFTAALICPLVIGGLWGSWLPAAFDDPPATHSAGRGHFPG